MNGLTILSECYIDTCLIETITNCFNQFNHQKSCGKVSKVMQEKFKDSFALGIIDKDKHEIAYIKEFELLVSNDSLFLYKHKTRFHYLIQISPAIEKFFLKAVKEKEIKLTNYGLPSEFEKIRKISKRIADKNETDFKKFKRLFSDLSDTSEFRALANLVLYLGEKSYHADNEYLKKIMVMNDL